MQTACAHCWAQGWWWERAGLFSDGGDEDERFTWAVCASSILRNLALSRANHAQLAEPGCLALLVGAHRVSCLSALGAL